MMTRKEEELFELLTIACLGDVNDVAISIIDELLEILETRERRNFMARQRYKERRQRRNKEREMYGLKGVKKPIESVRTACDKHPHIVRIPSAYALRALQEKCEGSSENVQKTTDPQSAGESSEPGTSSEQDQTEEQTDAEARRLTASGRLSKVPSRLDSLEEWKRVMECPQLGSPKRKSSSAGGSKRTREDQDRPIKMKRVKDCIVNKAGQNDVNAEETEVIEKRLPLFQNGAENIVYLVQAEARGIQCFHCKAKEANKWHVFGGEVSCDVCALDRAGSDRPVDIDRPQAVEKMSTYKISSEELTTEIICMSEYTREELKAMADASNARLGIM
jgi:hypothetical protein